MAIAVHCPNPGCAKIHQVKDKYAGTRGKCPLCGSWMYVPVPAPVAAPPKIAAPVTVPAIDETPAPPVEEPAPKPAPVPKAAPVVPARRPAPEPEPEPFIVPEVAFFVLLGLLLSLVTRRVGFLTLFFLYLSVLGSSVLLFGSGFWLEEEIGPKGHVTTLQKTIDQKRQDGKITEAPTITLGYQL